VKQLPLWHSQPARLLTDGRTASSGKNCDTQIHVYTPTNEPPM